ncbi:MAG TPA: outer membrane lipoprotein carrier protein LolA [Nitrospiria bacterium]|nr:outer membrane lipoprotein carrier protein LolA [Nitrospiria bacterium]
MKRFILLNGTFIAILLFSYSADASPLSLEELTAKMQTVYRALTDLKTSFSQETSLAGFKTAIRSEGELWLKKRSKMKLAYLKPKPQEIYINGAEMITYFPEEKQAIQGVFSAGEESKLPLRLLSGEAIFDREFEIRMDPARGGPSYRLVMTPRRKEEELERIEAEVDGVTFLISALRLIQANGNVSTFRFTNVHVNSGLKDSLFTFIVPEGTDLIKPLPSGGKPTGLSP